MAIIKENFRSYGELLETLRKRPQSKYMKSENSSTSTSDPEWSGTNTYEEAEAQIQAGYLKAMENLEKNIAAANKIASKYTAMLDHPIPQSAIAGYAPNVPNAIRGVPQSMIASNRKPMKKKTLSIAYVNCGLAECSADFFIKAGSALLSAIDIIERNGIQTEIDLYFKYSKYREEMTMASVRIKNYGERYSLQKISFPIACPAMFRRFGFKWLETNPNITVWHDGYGKTQKDLSYINETPNQKVISAYWIDEHNYSIEEILKKLEVI